MRSHRPDAVVLVDARRRVAVEVELTLKSRARMERIVAQLLGEFDVSLQPPLLSFCAGRASITWQRMRHAGRCTIHVLGARHGGFARRAAPPGADRFAEPDVVRDALAAIECDLEAEHAAGDHWIVVGRVRRLRLASDAQPLVYFAGRFGGFHTH